MKLWNFFSQSNFICFHIIILIIATRLEEKESEMKKEYSKLHERYNELRRSHFDLMERVKIILGTDMDNKDQSLKEPPNFSNLSGVFRTNLQKFVSNEDNMENYDLSGMSTMTPRVDDDDSFIHSNNSFVTSAGTSSLSNRQDRWIETEMSYDDTTTIIEDVEELQKDNNKDKNNRDQSLSGILKFLIFFNLLNSFQRLH